MARWARLKGIDLLSTGDFTHPEWLLECRRELREAGDGLFDLDGTHFILGTEVSCVAEQGGRSRRVHMLLYAPSFETVERINVALSGWGRLDGDGRPTLRTTPRDLVDVILDVDERCLVIPAHVWTPWYGLLGSKSGFDSLEECLGDAAGRVYAVESGLSSDPAMNWRVPFLDEVSIVSFSDAHSPANLGRELTVLPGEPSYDHLARSLMTQDIEYTVEFFPQEGKYHLSGHRKCGVCYSPAEVRRNGQKCPECGRRITLGVMQRVEELAAREVESWRDGDGFIRGPNGRPPFRPLVALRQVIAEGLGCGPDTKRAREAYLKLTSDLGGELSVLTTAPLADVAALSDERTAEGVGRVRAGEVQVEPGYDGLYGTVKIWPDQGERG